MKSQQATKLLNDAIAALTKLANALSSQPELFDAASVRDLSPDQRAVISILKEAGKPLRSQDIVNRLRSHKAQPSLHKMIYRLARAGIIAKDGYGHYKSAEAASPSSPTKGGTQ